jgi:hypothetical protein
MGGSLAGDNSPLPMLNKATEQSGAHGTGQPEFSEGNGLGHGYSGDNNFLGLNSLYGLNGLGGIGNNLGALNLNGLGLLNANSLQQ